jgi:hypothetical protein
MSAVSRHGVKLFADAYESLIIEREFQHDMQDAEKIEGGHSQLVISGINTQRNNPESNDSIPGNRLRQSAPSASS